MKKNFTVLFAFLCGMFFYAQFDVSQNIDGAVISDGTMLNFSETNCASSDPCKWEFTVTNTSANTIYVQIFVDNMVNTNGQNVQLCFAGVCLNSVTLNTGYPSNAVMIDPGVALQFGNYFWNQNPVGSPAMSWELRFQAFSDAAATTTIGNPLSVTYNYDQTFSVDTLTEDEINVFYSSSDDKLNITAPQAVIARVYDLQGRLIMIEQLDADQKTMNASELGSQVYIINLETEGNQTFTRKIMISK